MVYTVICGNKLNTMQSEPADYRKTPQTKRKKRHGKEKKMEKEPFLVEKLDDITKDHFAAALLAAMADPTTMQGLLGIPCGSEFDLFHGKEKAVVRLRNWSNMIDMLITSESGNWLVSAHIDGLGIEGVIEAAWQNFLMVKPYIETHSEKAFKDIKKSEDYSKVWLQNMSKVEALLKRLSKGDNNTR